MATAQDDNIARLRKLPIDALTKMYREVRTKKEQEDRMHKDRMSIYRDSLDKVENVLLEKLDEEGATSIATAAGTVYKRKLTRASVKDFGASLEFIRSHDMWHALEKRISKKAVEDYIEETGEQFPGVEVTSIIQVNIRAK